MVEKSAKRNRNHELPYRATGPDQTFVAMDKFSCSIGTSQMETKVVKYKPLISFNPFSCTESTCVFLIDNDKNIKLSKPLGYFEKVVFDSVLTIWHRYRVFDGGEMNTRLIIDIDDILRGIRNTNDVRWVSDTFRQNVIDALRKIWGTKIKLDVTAEFAARGKDAKKVFRCGTEANLLEMRLMTAEEVDDNDKRRSKEKICKVYLLAEPLLYTYATQIKHYEQINPAQFPMPEGRITSERVARYGYIKDRVLLLARTRSAHETILFSEIEKYALNRVYEEECAQNKKDLKNYVMSIMDSFKNNGVIADWSPITAVAKNGTSAMVGVKVEAVVPRYLPETDAEATQETMTDEPFRFDEVRPYNPESVITLDLEQNDLPI